MCPNILIANTLIPSWYLLLAIGAIISAFLAFYACPSDFPLGRSEILMLSALLFVTGLLGARVLHLILNPGHLNIKAADIISPSRGFAYFGTLVFALLTLIVYARLRKVRFLVLADYAMPFLLLSQVFVRIGCFLAGCCYGKPTSAPFGIVFKTGDGLTRHPTQIYEIIVLLAAYITGRLIYKKAFQRQGETFSISLAIYALGRFFVESLRTDSPIFILGLTVAQVTCLAVLSLAAFLYIYGRANYAAE
ncbi:MAG: prolipoprotein diacylglyceryl transferase [Candidatus Omnitrophica bacterium]|nr:prolipoprotein diacylglyceryl transferase [Candidatus Omnitrophota bacterium]